VGRQLPDLAKSPFDPSKIHRLQGDRRGSVRTLSDTESFSFSSLEKKRRPRTRTITRTSTNGKTDNRLTLPIVEILESRLDWWLPETLIPYLREAAGRTAGGPTRGRGSATFAGVRSAQSGDRANHLARDNGSAELVGRAPGYGERRQREPTTAPAGCRRPPYESAILLARMDSLCQEMMPDPYFPPTRSQQLSFVSLDD